MGVLARLTEKRSQPPLASALGEISIGVRSLGVRPGNTEW